MTIAATYTRPNNTVQSASAYKANIDGDFQSSERMINRFAPHAAASPNMTVVVDAGWLFDGTTSLTEVAQQSTSTIVAPVSNPRIDRVVVDSVTGAVSVITGTEAASPSAPAVTKGKLPVAQVTLQTSSTSITNSMVTDERALTSTPSAITKILGMLKFGAVNMTQNATSFPGPVGLASNATESSTQYSVSAPVVVSELRAILSAAVPASNTITVTLRKNGVDTALTFTITAGNTTGSDVTHSVSFDVTDLLGIKVVTSATFGTTNDIGITAVVKAFNTPSGSDSGISLGLCFGQVNNAGGGAIGEPAATSAFTTDALGQVPVRACVSSAFRNDGGSGGASLTIHNNGTVVTSTLATVTDIDRNANCFADNDLISVIQGAASTSLGSILFTDPNGRSPNYSPIFFSVSAQAQNTTKYATGYGGITNTGTESDVQIPMPACVISGLRGNTDATPAAGQSVILTVRKNGVDTSLTVTLNNGGKTAADTTHSVTFAAGDLLSIKSVSSATVGTRTTNMSMEVAPTS